VDVQRFAADPEAFRADLVIPAAGGPERFGACMADFQAKDFRALDPSFIALRDGGRPPVGRFWLERTKGASKDSDLATLVLWLLAFSKRSLTIQIGAADKDQADEMRKAAKAVLRLNPWLAALVEVQSWSIRNPRTDSAAEIIPADVVGSHGARPDLLILNELSHIAKQEFAANLMDNAAKVPAGVVVIATNAGFDPSWQIQWREAARTSSRWYFSAVSDPAPWLDPAEIDEAERRNSPSRFARLWGGIWVSGGGDALEPADVQAAVRADLGPMVGTEPGWLFVAGLDLGVKQDRAALCILGKHVGHAELAAEQPEARQRAPVTAALVDLGILDAAPEPEPVYNTVPGTSRLRLAWIQSWAPGPGGQVDLSAVENAVLAAHNRFNLAAVNYDPHQCALLAQRATAAGVPMVETSFTGSNLDAMASGLLEVFKAREVDLYLDPALVADLGKLRIVERSFGYKLEAPRDATGHADRATALTLAVLGARRFAWTPAPTVPGDLLCWPG
jgi:hypothetical protein